ncbi:hypothetical protein VTN00DRAFT_5954 [Thermoascus crustaceus]
MQLIQKPTRQL